MRGQQSPLFIQIMTFNDQVKALVNQALAEKPELFLIDLKISDSLKITVVIDGDFGVTLQDCVDVSRVVEHNLDREAHDFALEVYSAGVSNPLKCKRQYVKNIGRNIKTTTQTAEFMGLLTEVTEDYIVLETKTREPKKIGKGKETVIKQTKIDFQDIKETIVTIISK